MRKLIVFAAVAFVCAVIGMPAFQAQLRDLDEPAPVPERGIVIEPPGEDDDDDDEADDCSEYPAVVAKTGQTDCWDEQGDTIDCSGTGQDAEYQMGVSVSPRFTDSGDGTVTDNLTGLIWLKDASCLGLDVWTGALSSASTLANGTCELTDGSVAGSWRLPNVNELQSLLDYGHFNPPLPPEHPFVGVQTESYYWTSTTYRDGLPGYRAWIIAGGGSYKIADPKNMLHSVWPVRGGP